MKILLIYPTRLDENGNPVKYTKAFIPPLALAVLNSLTPAHHTVVIYNDLVENINFTEDCDLVGITAMTSQITRAYQIADRFRKRHIKVVIGGIHATVLPDEVKEHADAVVIGEVDNLWPLILIDCEKGTLKDFYKDDSLPDLKKSVIPCWDNMNLNIYPKQPGEKFPYIPLFTTRGCPINCKFCSVTKYFGKKFRVKPIKNVLAEIDSIGAHYFSFNDDNLTFNPDYCRELFTALSKKDIQWISQASTHIMNNPDLIELAVKAGCYSLVVGIESIKKENLIAVNKGFNHIEAYEELIKRLRNAGIIPFLSFIFGFDEDTPEQFRLTLEFLKKNKVGFAFFWILTPLPGTDLYDEFKKSGRISEPVNWSQFDLSQPVFTPLNFSAGELTSIYWKSFQKLYSLKNYFKTIVNSVKISKNPVKEFFSTAFYFLYYRNKVRHLDHPFSGGIGLRIN